jgi:elongator complex protein 3
LNKPPSLDEINCSLINYVSACRYIADRIKAEVNQSRKEIYKIIRQGSAFYSLTSLPKNEDILRFVDRSDPVRELLMVKPVKTSSGVVVIAVMPKPYTCPQGKCIYCPGGITINTPPSYTGQEPVTRQAQRFEYDPFLQIHSKLAQIESLGHETGKVELVIVGGTFPFMPEDYQRDFITTCFHALNNSNTKICESSSLTDAMRENETAKSRCVGLTVETKPDYCKSKHVDLMLDMGVTRIELGVQSLQEGVIKAINRGHTISDVVESFRVARESGFKLVAHMMPGLPGSSPEEDIQDFCTLIENPHFKPDMLKIYPTLVLEHTPLYDLYKAGKYTPYTLEEIVKVLFEVKKRIPPWIRIMRVQREIDSSEIIAGPTCGNLRQIVLRRLHDQGLKCHCIRCREVGKQSLGSIPSSSIILNRIDYDASEGREVFLSFETKDQSKILGFLRLRKIVNSHRKELSQDCAIVRELHVYGSMLSVGSHKTTKSCQHTGYGLKLMHEAERISGEEFGVSALFVISAVGTREYYKKIGYSIHGPYMVKVL